MERETQIDLSEKLITLVHSKTQGVEGLEPLIEEVVDEIMERGGIEPETRKKFVDH